MSEKKDLFGVKVWNVAVEYNLTQVTVHKVIDLFVQTCRGLLLNGYVLRLKELATITPSVQMQDYIPTLGYICKLVSEECKIPYYTVYAVIDAYLGTIQSDVLAGKNADIRKLISFHSIVLDANKFKVNCFMSASLRSELRDSEVQTGARASLNKMLRNRIKEGVA